MNILKFPELFVLISDNLNDEEKVFITPCSKITRNFKSLIVLDLEYSLVEINDKWRAKNIFIINFSLENKIKELIENLIPESLIISYHYVKFISNNTNITLFYNEKLIEKLVSDGFHYMAMKIMLNNDESAENINNQFIKSSECGYLSRVKLLIENGANIHFQNNQALILASKFGHLSVFPVIRLVGFHGNRKSEAFCSKIINRIWCRYSSTK